MCANYLMNEMTGRAVGQFRDYFRLSVSHIINQSMHSAYIET